LDLETNSRSGDGTPAEGADTVRGYGRVDSQEALDRAREVSKELHRLHTFLPELSNAELSAYSTKSLPIGTFLQSKGQTFSVLTEDMLANAFKEETERRRKEADRLAQEADLSKTETTVDRWLKKIKDNPVVAALMILTLAAGGITPFVKDVGQWIPNPRQPPSWAGTWVGTLYSCNEPTATIKTEIRDSGDGEFTETSFVGSNRFGPFTFTYDGRKATTNANNTTYQLNIRQDSITVNSPGACQAAALQRQNKSSPK
jgi:hypothetical protein